MSQQLPGGQHESLCRRVHRLVRGMFDDVEALKVNPHGVGRIRKPPVGEGVRRQQVAELVVPSRLWNSKNWHERGAQQKYPCPHHEYGEVLVAAPVD